MSSGQSSTGSFLGHPNGLFLLFTVEMWERFSYYGMRAIFILFLTKALLIDAKESSGIYGIYTSLVYATPLLGGFIADRYWGNRRSILVGGILMAIAQFLMFLSASMYATPSSSIPVMYVALAFLIFGNGFFKPNISSMVGSLYPQGDSRIDAAYTIFYMGINAGAFFAPLVTGFLGDTGNAGDFQYGFLAACIGMVIGTITMLAYQNKYIKTPEGEPIGLPPKAYKKVAEDGSDIPEAKNAPLTKVEKQRIWAIFIITGFVIAFWAAFEQAGASLTLFADQNTDRNIFGWEMPASYFQSVNPLFIMTLAPLFSILWLSLSKRGKEPSSPMKMVWGLLLLGLGYVLIGLAVKGVGLEDKISMFYLIGMYFLHTCGELAISPVGLSVVNKLSPKRMVSSLMAVFFLSSVFGNYLGGLFSGLIPQPEVTSVIVSPTSSMDSTQVIEYSARILNKSENVLEAAILKRFEKSQKDQGITFSRDSIVKFDTLFNSQTKMVYGQLDGSSKVAFGSAAVIKDSLNLAVDANIAKDFRGDKNFIVRDIFVNDKHEGALILTNTKATVFGFEIGTLFAFFMIFVIMSGATGILLFLLHKKVEGLMHGVR